MRARLHHKFKAQIAMLDAVRTREDPDGPGVLTSGFDDDFDEIIVFTKTGARESGREDQPSVLVPCNVESDSWEVLQQMMAGNAPNTLLKLIVHRRDLERLELMRRDTGEPKIRVNDRLLGIWTDGCSRAAYVFEQSLFVTQVRPSFGIGCLPDLFVVTCEDRQQAASA